MFQAQLPASSQTSLRQAFTLIELLVVISIIVLLVGLLAPVVVGAGQSADQLVCKNNLTQIGKAIIEWRVEAHADSNKFPGQLTWLSDASKGGPMEGQMDIYKCPFDESDGDDDKMGRGSMTDYGDSSPYESGCSYFYEMSNTPCPSDWVPGGTSASWADWKRWQVKFGNSSLRYPQTSGGKPYPLSKIPVVRCFHHESWSSSTMNKPNSVYNVAWDTKFFTSSVKWEDDVDQAAAP